MSVFDHMAWAKRQTTGSVGAKAVLMALAERTGDEPVCFPSQRLIGEETEQCERTVRTHLRTLEDLGLIESSRRYVDASGRPLPRGRACNQYRLLVDQPADIAGGQPVDNPGENPVDDGSLLSRPTGNLGTTNRQAVAGEEPVGSSMYPPLPPRRRRPRRPSAGPEMFPPTVPLGESTHPSVVAERRRQRE